MNGATFKRVIKFPLAKPVSAPAAVAARIATSGPLPPTSTKATMTDVMATIEPTDRSMPPRMMTRVMPRAAVPTIAVCRAIVSSVRTDVKLSGPASAKKR